MTWAIATSSRREEVAISHSALDVKTPVKVVDGTSVSHAKPDPALLLLAASELGIEPGACWYVGDAVWDVMAAVAAQMTPVAVTAGSAVGEAALWEAGAAAVVPTLQDVAELVVESGKPERRPGR